MNHPKNLSSKQKKLVNNWIEQGSGVFFIISEMKDKRHAGGAGFFPECLRSEYHEIRHAMEAYSRSATIAGREEGTANGIALDKGESLTVRIHSGDGCSDYKVVLE